MMIYCCFIRELDNCKDYFVTINKKERFLGIVNEVTVLLLYLLQYNVFSEIFIFIFYFYKSIQSIALSQEKKINDKRDE